MVMGTMNDHMSMSPASSPPSSPNGAPKALTPEQKRAMKTLVSALYVADKNVRSIPEDKMLTTDFISFSSRPIKKHMVWSDTWWAWNQSNAKSYAHIDKNTFVTIRKLNPRKKRGVGGDMRKPAYKLWIFHIEYANYQPCWCLWCERGVQSDTPMGFTSRAAPVPVMTKRLSAPQMASAPAKGANVYPSTASFPPPTHNTTDTMDVSPRTEVTIKAEPVSEMDIMSFESIFPNWTDSDSKDLARDLSMTDLLASSFQDIDRYLSAIPLTKDNPPVAPGSYVNDMSDCGSGMTRLFPSLTISDTPMMD